MSNAVHVPYTVEQDADGVWCAHAQLRPGVGAHGEGDNCEAAIANLQEALIGLIAEFGVPDELTLMLDVALMPPVPSLLGERVPILTHTASRRMVCRR
jgi:predicted RNase H-like HicB family nuclease